MLKSHGSLGSTNNISERAFTRMKYLWGTLFALAVLFVVLGVIYLTK
ncbi:hypothetical protein GCM10010911_03120 [Paenibacillus nasutitermitis]|uniref:Uncharacterized protein n=1 Tax=Paenibacillus nasutitermitis TaxID=1652958 RepID=A0A917DLW9_9BACL|nr:hypothetical protein GCM10010911_03120 [Paenibacillus nasutitermitis]